MRRAAKRRDFRLSKSRLAREIEGVDPSSLDRQLRQAMANAAAQAPNHPDPPPGCGQTLPFWLGGVECIAFPLFTARIERRAGEPARFKATAMMRLWDVDEAIMGEYALIQTSTDWFSESSVPDALDLMKPLLVKAALAARRHPMFRIRREAVLLSRVCASELAHAGGRPLVEPSRRAMRL